MDFTAAAYFDAIDKDEQEQELENPRPKPTVLGRIWALRTAIL